MDILPELKYRVRYEAIFLSKLSIFLYPLEYTPLIGKGIVTGEIRDH
jgi:hypothetical protein